MRIRMPCVLALIGVAEAMGCTNANVHSDWSCSEAAVPNGQRIECSSESLTVQDTPYTCNSYGDYNPNCPPVGAGSDGGTTDFNPISTGTGIDAGGGTSDGVPPGASSSGPSSGAGGNGSNGKGVGPAGGTSDGVPPGLANNGGGSGAGANGGGHGPPWTRDAGTGNASSSGSGSGSGQNGGNNGGSQGSEGGAPWACVPNPPEVVCSKPPSCAPGSHAAPCGACVTNDSTADCQPPSEGGCWVTGGGFVVDSGGKDTFGGNAMPMKDGTVRGEWEDQDHGSGDAAHGQANYIFCRTVPGPGPGHPNGPRHDFTVNQVYFGGPARWFASGSWADGYWFDVVAEDHGEPGRADTYHFTIRTYANSHSGAIVYETSGTLSGGNIQIHPPNPGHPATQSALPPWVQLQP